MYDMIKIGDTVTVCWPQAETIKGVVHHIPQATDECWVIETANAIHYIQHFDTIWKSK